ncbi:SGNH hydrolase-type esterase domain-containing protein [Talaromyces proteolyticus]|uniref:SGNH hydrolase-type esterase domain-containing protein n=1 Tax=Talaromyces proteolyticus TaxID=1131652 RepID=A0AAD4KET9_9EURO|nr:SGNH hydrolase-type esterase domain-containing protein [Talaromyces proteolyticus]KAH8689427.1 SGNH hydrolase-type esterase domain-containing protein [Talaromyces proteolyticus]
MPAPSNRRLHIVSLGSSFAAGPGIHPQIAPRAGRSGQNYPHILARLLDAHLTDLTVSGATLLNIIVDPQQHFLFRSVVFPPQITLLPSSANIITITAGGNDLEYIGGMVQDAWAAGALGKIVNFIVGVVRRVYLLVRRRPRPAEQALQPLTEEALITRLGRVLDAIHAKAPNARVFLVEYLAVLGANTQPGKDVPFSQDRIDYHRQTARKLQRAYVQAAESRAGWCERVAIHDSSAEHGLGSQVPWVGGFGYWALLRRGSVFHPNLAGMQAVAEVLVRKIDR